MAVKFRLLSEFELIFPEDGEREDCSYWKGEIDRIDADNDSGYSKRLEREARDIFSSLNAKDREIAVVLDTPTASQALGPKTKLILKGKPLEKIREMYPDAAFSFETSVTVSSHECVLMKIDNLTSELLPVKSNSSSWRGMKDLWKLIKMDTFGLQFASSEYLKITSRFPEDLDCYSYSLNDFVVTVTLPQRTMLMTSETDVVRAGQMNSEVTSKILVENSYTDLTLVAGDGTEVQCHRCFLSAQSDFFKAMLDNDSTKESQSGRIEVKFMSGEGIKALLEFVYTSVVKISSIERNPMVALELLQASHAYFIKALQETMKNIFLVWPKYFIHFSDKTVEVGLQLFKFAGNLEDVERDQGWEQLKQKATEILKSRSQNLLQSKPYKTLLAENATVAKEILSHLMEH